MARKIIFVKPNTPYQSYTDFWRLVELSGFEICSFPEIRLDKKRVYVVSPYNFEWKPFMGDEPGERKARLVLWDLERPIPRGGFKEYTKHGHGLLDSGYFDEVWVSDRQLARDTGFGYITLGSDHRLAAGLGSAFQLNAPKRKAYDYAHMSYVNKRRKKILRKMPGSCAPNCWPPERNDMLPVARFGLNLHQDDGPWLEPLRLALFAAYGLPIVTEMQADAWPYTGHVVQAGAKRLPRLMRELLATDYAFWDAVGVRTKDLMCDEFNFKKMVREAVRNGH